MGNRRASAGWHRRSSGRAQRQQYQQLIPPSRGLNPKTRWDDGILRHDHDPVADVIICGVEVGFFAFRGNDDAVANACILVDDGAIDHAIAPNTYRWHTRLDRSGIFEMIATHDHAVTNGCAAADDTAHADHAAFDMGVGNDAAIGDDCLPQGSAIDFTSG